MYNITMLKLHGMCMKKTFKNNISEHILLSFQKIGKS